MVPLRWLLGVEAKCRSASVTCQARFLYLFAEGATSTLTTARDQMTNLMSDPTASLDSLSTSFAALQFALSSLHTRPWSETTESLSSLERAKMDILLAYAINDLIWGELYLCTHVNLIAKASTVYLKMKGIDPETHEVSSELVCEIFHPN